MKCTVATGSIGSRNNTVPRLLRSVTRTLAPAVSPLAMRRRGDAWQLRVYAGIDPATGRKPHGGTTEAESEDPA